MASMIKRTCTKCPKVMLAYTERQSEWMLRQHMLTHEVI